MARQKTKVPHYGTTTVTGGHQYLRTRVRDAYGHRIPIYGKTPEEVAAKKKAIVRQIEDCPLRRSSPTVKEYCETWILMQSHLHKPTLDGYRSRIKNYIISPLGDLYMADVTPDDVQMAMLLAADKSQSLYKNVTVLFKSIFSSAKESHIIDEDPTIYLSAKGGGIPQKEKIPLTDGQVETLLDAVKGLQTHVFVMLGLYAGLRREEILGLQWDSVFLDGPTPYLVVQRAWHPENNNRTVVTTDLKTKAANRDIPLPDCLAECLRETKKESKSDYVIANDDGNPLSYTQFKQLWHRVVTRSAKERTYCRYENGVRVKHTIHPKLGEKAAHNGQVTYTIDFDVTPHLLRHTYITNLIFHGVDPKTVQYLAGHENIKITMDVYATVKYYCPKDLVPSMEAAFDRWVEQQSKAHSSTI